MLCTVTTWRADSTTNWPCAHNANVFFKNAKLHSYYSPALVRQGVMTLQQALQSNMKAMPQGWIEVY